MFACKQALAAGALLLAAGAIAAPSAASVPDAPPPVIVALQGGRTAQTATAADRTRATLTNLAPRVGSWFLLTVSTPARLPASYHLEVPRPGQTRLAVEASPKGALSLRVQAASGSAEPCVIALPRGLDAQIAAAQRDKLPYAALCGHLLSVRNPVRGRRTPLEATTEFLRDRVWKGEEIVGFVRHQFYQDAFALRAASAPASGALGRDPAARPGAPAAPTLRTAAAGTTVDVPELGLELDAPAGRLAIGRWSAVRGVPGVFASVLEPDAVQGRSAAWQPAGEEADALDFFVAFDLSRFDLGFALGTEHPRLGWSERAPASARDAALPGPDGFDSAAPLVRTGMLSPDLLPRVVATFTGGFKREHGAFRYGTLAARNHASHYGFVEQGVTFSTLQPGLSTLFVDADGRVDMKTWSAVDAARASVLRHARQNGVALVELGADGRPGPGALVDQWSAGNWSGSADERLRTLRAGACLLDDGARRFLVYGYFSTATPATMAQVFLALGCRYAMHLDMNALEHTYLALYGRDGARIEVQHLVRGMSVLDQDGRDGMLPRFIGFPDDRDFFYILRKETSP